MRQDMDAAIRFREPCSASCNPSIILAFTSASDTDDKRQNSEYRFQYRQIGRALLLCEQNYLQVGVPWVWGPKRFPHITLGSHKEPLKDFVKVQLVGIKTKVLYSYERDLRQLNCDLESYRTLHLQDFPISVRYSPALLLLLALVVLFCPFWGMAFPDLRLAFMLSCFSATIPGLLVARLSSEYHRRLSFARLIATELLRRKGQGPGNKTTLPLFSAREPIS